MMHMTSVRVTGKQMETVFMFKKLEVVLIKIGNN